MCTVPSSDIGFAAYIFPAKPQQDAERVLDGVFRLQSQEVLGRAVLCVSPHLLHQSIESKLPSTSGPITRSDALAYTLLVQG